MTTLPGGRSTSAVGVTRSGDRRRRPAHQGAGIPQDRGLEALGEGVGVERPGTAACLSGDSPSSCASRRAAMSSPVLASIERALARASSRDASAASGSPAARCMSAWLMSSGMRSQVSSGPATRIASATTSSASATRPASARACARRPRTCGQKTGGVRPGSRTTRSRGRWLRGPRPAGRARDRLGADLETQLERERAEL